ncbi:MAG: YdbH domain-containing protein [Novosphingobium sp.]
MAEDTAEAGDFEKVAAQPRRRRWRRVLGALAVLLFLALTTAWCSRERIAENIISGQVDQLGVPAAYKIESIGLDRQVISNVVIGDPRHPDMTIERVEAQVETWWGVPGLGRITLVRPRLYGTYRDGKLSFGKLDKLLFEGPSKEPFRLPDYDIRVIDGRGLMETDYGPVGFKAEGEGALRGGFTGIVAAVAPKLDIEGCTSGQTSIFGTVKTTGEKLRFTGPLRLAGMTCPAAQLRLAASGIEIDTTLDPAFDGVEGKFSLAAGQLSYGSERAAKASGDAQFTFRKRSLTARYDLGVDGYQGSQARMASLEASGGLRTQNMFARVQGEGSLNGKGLALGSGLDGALSAAQSGSADTLAQPLIAKLRAALAQEQRSSSFAANFLLRKNGPAMSLTVPQASLRGASGEALLAVSRLQVEQSGSAAPVLAGAFATGGPGLPKVVGRLDTGSGGGFSARFSMAEYASGDARVAIPEMILVTLRDGSLGFAGAARLSGALPGGGVRNLVLPVKGSRTPAGGLAVWRECTPVGFDSLSLAGLTLDRRAITLCPPRGGTILAADARGMRLAAGAPSLTISGKLGDTPMRLSSGPIGFAWPGNLAARTLDVELGPQQTASRFRIANLTARLGTTIAGRFADSDVFLDAVPLDILDAEGDWNYANGKLTLANASLRLEDREQDDRFKPMMAQGAVLELLNNRIVANAVMREPESRRAVVRAAILHNLNNGAGSADLSVDDLTLDPGLQPDQLTPMALGVIANAKGHVHGRGRIDWNAERVTSAGRLTIDTLDFAAAFGPVEGLTGTIDFTDLLGMVTAPHQKLRIAGINPGIEVNDGELLFAMMPGNVLQIEGAHWPFLDGTLVLEPTRLVLGEAEVRRFTLRIAGLDAAKFVQRMELANISTTGIFDGALPLVFDENGGSIAGGHLDARPPGGNVSYVGALTYKDMSTMANFAFDVLKSIDYRQMRIDMNGPLDGEIVTRVSFEGIRQGEGAKRNFLTNQIAKLPIRFNLNLRAPFFQLVTSMRSLYDPLYVRDPRTMGLVGADGKPIAPKPGVQPPVSGGAP